MEKFRSYLPHDFPDGNEEITTKENTVVIQKPQPVPKSEDIVVKK
jgi:hypothetical protein